MGEAQVQIGAYRELRKLTNKMGLNMKHQVSMGKFVMVVLGCYFAFEIINAGKRLQSGKIGTLFGKVKQKTLQGKKLKL